MGPQQQNLLLRNNIERPPYYHLPRSRPVTFEQPSHARETGSIYHYQSASSTNKTNTSLPSYNNSPRPFSQGQQSTVSNLVAPRIIINNQSYPTSTVHKSMLHCKRPIQHTSDGQAPMSRLVEPAVMTASYESPLPQTVNLNSNTGTGVNTPYSPDQNEYDDGQYASSVAEAVIHAAQSKSQRHLRQEPAYIQDATSWEGRSSNLAAGLRNASQHRGVDAGANRGTRLANLSRIWRDPMQSRNVVLPDSKRDEYMWDKQIEQKSIAHQTYRTLPIVSAKPKTRHDLAGGTYMQYNQDPTWDLYTHSRPPSASSMDHERKIQLAMNELY